MRIDFREVDTRSYIPAQAFTMYRCACRASSALSWAPLQSRWTWFVGVRDAVLGSEASRRRGHDLGVELLRVRGGWAGLTSLYL
jgi:hypothetical protein